MTNWNERYAQEGYAYGEEPNEYLRDELAKLKAGKLLLPAEGEGRNAVYAAGVGWAVEAFDQSEPGRIKAVALAKKKGVTISYQIGNPYEVAYEPASFDAVAFIYAHFPGEVKAEYNRRIAQYLKPGGTLIFEAFGKGHLAYQKLNPEIGGPKDIAMLYSVEEVKRDFSNFDTLYLAEEEVQLNEGAYHVGRGLVVRFVGRKIVGLKQ